jgi:hypothetical protein
MGSTVLASNPRRDTMTIYTAHLAHHSISRSTVHTLKAATLTAAKREARKLLGDGYQGQTIRLCEVMDGQRIPVAVATIGERGWYDVQ